MLIDSAMADEFLASYKAVLAEVNGGKKAGYRNRG